MIPIDCFEGQSSDGRLVPIVPGGRSVPLTFSNRKQYVERAVAFRLHEMDLQVSRPRARGSVTTRNASRFHTRGRHGLAAGVLGQR